MNLKTNSPARAKSGPHMGRHSQTPTRVTGHKQAPKHRMAENPLCTKGGKDAVGPGKEIEMEHPGHGSDFSRAAQGMRGVTASVERPGALSIGDELTLYTPTQPAWAG